MDIIKTYYDDNITVKEVYQVVNGLKQGEYKGYYKSGALKKLGYYIDDKLDGKYEEYFHNGKTYFIENFKNGIQVGEYLKYYNTGQLKISSNYENNELNGKYESYHMNGDMNMICHYKDNNII
jgi:antitoxin component YwqK of YwqJK toxin-antitoxin module